MYFFDHAFLVLWLISFLIGFKVKKSHKETTVTIGGSL